MRILFDGRIFQFQKAGGINRYFAEIISGLPADWSPTILGIEDLGRNAPSHPNLRTLTPPDFRPRRFRLKFQETFWKPRLLRSLRLVHPTYYDLTCGLTYRDFKCPVVITVHDLIYALYPEQMGEDGEAVVSAQKEAVARADHIICVSRATERDLLAVFPQAAGKTSVCYHGSSFPISQSTVEKPVSDQSAFFYVGHRAGYKNFIFLLRAFARACESNPSIRLQVAGPPWTNEERWQLFFLKLTDRVTLHIYPSEEKLRQLYRESVALLYPSRLEGFGIPALEAMACGTLAITANTTSLPEVVGDAGVMLDPTAETDWTECMLAVAKGGPERTRMIERGYLRARQFTWQKTVEHHLGIYRRLA